MTTRPPAEEAGFSLVEALIALAIIAAMTLALLAAVIEDARGRRMMRERREALMVAQSALDNAVGGEGGDAGHWGRYVWHLDRDA